MADDTAAPAEQARDQTGQMQVRIRMDDAAMTTSYANAFRTNTSAEEVIVDFGMNILVPNQPKAGEDRAPDQPVGDINFKLNNRIVMNYYTAKRLAMMIGQVIRAHEERFGELKLNANERAVKK